VDKAGHSGYPKISGQVIWLVGNLGILLDFCPEKALPEISGTNNSGSGSGFTRYIRN
jgi:hypothetical protein